MAQRRMLSKQITETDLFMDMPLSAQALYLHLLMNADDDGFIGNAKTIMRMVGGSNDDFKILVAKNFIIVFDDGITVIKDWRIHNYIQKDRYHQTIYKDHLKMLNVDTNGAYIELKGMYTECIQDVSKMDTQVRLGKVSIGQVKEEEEYNQSLTRERELPNPEQIFKDTPQIQELSERLLGDLIVDAPEQAVLCVEAISGQYWRLRRLQDEGNEFVVLKDRMYGNEQGVLNILEEATKYALEHTKERLNDFSSFGSYFANGLQNRINTMISSGGISNGN